MCTKHHANDNYYMYNPETKRIRISRDIKWAPFQWPTFYNGLNEILKPKQQSQQSNNNDKNNKDDDLDQGGGSESDIESVQTEESMETDTEKKQLTQLYPGILQNLQLTFNPSFSRPQHRVLQPRTLNQVHKAQ